VPALDPDPVMSGSLFLVSVRHPCRTEPPPTTVGGCLWSLYYAFSLLGYAISYYLCTFKSVCRNLSERGFIPQYPRESERAEFPPRKRGRSQYRRSSSVASLSTCKPLIRPRLMMDTHTVCKPPACLFIDACHVL